MYYSVLLFTVNDICTTVTIERAFVAFMGIFSSIVNANIFGIIAVLVQDMKKKDIEFRSEMACITAVLDSNALFSNDFVPQNSMLDEKAMKSAQCMFLLFLIKF